MEELNEFEKGLMKMSVEEKKILVEKISQQAKNNEIDYCGCARVTLSALQQHLGLESSDAFKASLGLSGGVARNCEICGALLGALMAVGLAFGSDKLTFILGDFVKGKPEDKEATARFKKVMKHSAMICDRFREKFGGLLCTDAQRIIHDKVRNLGDPAQMAEFAQPETHDKCGEVTGITARIAAEVILG